MLHNLLMLMFNVLVQSFVFAEVKATTLTFDNRSHLFLIPWSPKSMICSQSDFKKFEINFQFGDVHPDTVLISASITL